MRRISLMLRKKWGAFFKCYDFLKEIEISSESNHADDCIYVLIGVGIVVQGAYYNYRVFFSRQLPLQLIDILYSGDSVTILL